LIPLENFKLLITNNPLLKYDKLPDPQHTPD